MTTLLRLQKDPLYRKRIEERMRIMQAIRDFFVARGFLEVQTPSLTMHPGMEPYLDPFETKIFNDKGRFVDVGLITSPEYSLKKLLSVGFEKIFEIAKVYRNRESFEGTHNAEFFMLEWYRRGADYKDIMDDIDELLVKVSEDKLGKGGSRAFASLPPKAERIKVRDIFLEKTGIDLDKVSAADELIAAGRGASFEMKEGERFEDAFFRIFLSTVEPSLKDYKNPIILYEYPIELASLAKAAENPRYAERFELYIKGVEIANAFSELTDIGEQQRRFAEEAELRKVLGKKVFPSDDELLSALSHIGKAGGIALGVDRLIMILLETEKIEDVLLFPTSELFGTTQLT